MNIVLTDKIIDVQSPSGKDCRYCHDLTKRNMMPYYQKYNLQWKGRKFRKKFKKRSYYILRHNNQRIGFFSIIIRKKICYFTDLQITKDFRNIGIGSHVFEIVENLAKKAKTSKIQLRVFLNNKAFELYVRQGYEIVETTESVYVMEKHLQTTR